MAVIRATSKLIRLNTFVELAITLLVVEGTVPRGGVGGGIKLVAGLKSRAKIEGDSQVKIRSRLPYGSSALIA